MRNLNHFKGVVALTISSLSYPIYAESPKSTAVYLDCEGLVATIEGGNRVSERKVYGYRFIPSQNVIEIYDEGANQYLNFCSMVACKVSRGSLEWSSSSDKDGVYVTNEYFINRWTGKMRGRSGALKGGEVVYYQHQEGKCVAGVSRIKVRPNF